MSVAVKTQGGGGGMYASIFVKGLSETDIVTASNGSKTKNGKWVEGERLVDTKIPIMDSDTYLDKSCSWEYNGRLQEPAWKAFDGNTHTSAYVSEVSSYPIYLVYDFGNESVKPDGFYGYAEHAWDKAGQGTGTFTVQLQGSNDGQNWENISGEVVWTDRGLKWHDSTSTEDVNIYTAVNTDKFYSKFRLAVLDSLANPSGSSVYCRIFAFQVTGKTKSVASGHEISKIGDLGTWTVTATNGVKTETRNVMVDAAVEYEIEMDLYKTYLYIEG